MGRLYRLTPLGTHNDVIAIDNTFLGTRENHSDTVEFIRASVPLTIFEDGIGQVCKLYLGESVNTW